MNRLDLIETAWVYSRTPSLSTDVRNMFAKLAKELELSVRDWSKS